MRAGQDFVFRLLLVGLPCICVSWLECRAGEPSHTRSLEMQVDRIQNGLLPAAYAGPLPPARMSLAERMGAYHVPGVAIAVIHDGSILWARGFGVARRNGPPIETSTLFEAGSISKPVTAFAALRLVDGGKMQLNADINDDLRSWKLPLGPRGSGPVTLLELLSHTAGTTVHGFPGYATGSQVPTTLDVLDGKPPANTQPIRVDIVPGTMWRYSGGGYVIVQQALVDVTGKSFPELMQDLVLRPLGMTSSTFVQQLTSDETVRAASPYEADGTPVKGGAHTYPEMAAAGLWTTAPDLGRFVIAVQAALAGSPGALLPQGLAQQMVASRLGHRGVMFAVGGFANDPFLNHDGVDEGFVSDLIAYEKGDGVVILTNGAGGYQLAQEIVRAVAHEYGWPDFRPIRHTIVPATATDLRRYEGRYELAQGAVMRVARAADHFAVEMPGEEPIDIFPEGHGRFFARAIDLQLTYRNGQGATASQVVIHEYGEDTIATTGQLSDQRNPGG